MVAKRKCGANKQLVFTGTGFGIFGWFGFKSYAMRFSCFGYEGISICPVVFKNTISNA